MFHTVPSDEEMIAANVDEFGDSYCRDVNVESLRKVRSEYDLWRL